MTIFNRICKPRQDWREDISFRLRDGGVLKPDRVIYTRLTREGKFCSNAMALSMGKYAIPYPQNQLGTSLDWHADVKGERGWANGVLFCITIGAGQLKVFCVSDQFEGLL